MALSWPACKLLLDAVGRSGPRLAATSRTPHTRTPCRQCLGSYPQLATPQVPVLQGISPPLEWVSTPLPCSLESPSAAHGPSSPARADQALRPARACGGCGSGTTCRPQLVSAAHAPVPAPPAAAQEQDAWLRAYIGPGGIGLVYTASSGGQLDVCGPAGGGNLLWRLGGVCQGCGGGQHPKLG